MTSNRFVTGLLAAMIASICFTVYCGFRQSRDWNSASRLLLTYAVAERGSVEITDYVARGGVLLKDPATRDLSSPRPGEFYCDKAPGHSLLGAAPVWLAHRLGLADPYPIREPVKKHWPTDLWAIRGVNSLLTALTAGLIVVLLKAFQASTLSAGLAGLAFGLATHAMPYATVYYGHSSAGFFCLASLASMHFARSANRPLGAAAAGGFFAGAAVVAEYTLAVLPIAIVATCLIELVGAADRRKSKAIALAAFLIGGIPPAMFLAWYHTRITGSPWIPPYKFEVEAVFAYHREGTGIPISLPEPRVVWQLLVGERRGLIWFAPVAAMGMLACFRALGDDRRRVFSAEALMVFLGLLAINAGFPAWDGGWSSGPRFLLPALPPLCVAAGWLGSDSNGGRSRTLQRILMLLWTVAVLMGAASAFHCTHSGVAMAPGSEHPIFAWLKRPG